MVYLIIILLNNNVSQINTLFTSEEVYACMGLALLFTESFRVCLILSNKIASNSNAIPSVIIQLLLSTGATIILISTGLLLYFTYSLGYAPSKFEYQLFNGIFILINLLLNLINISFYYSTKENTIKIDAERTKTESVKLELQDYKNDINEILLYQSLEKLIVLIHDDTEKAEELIDDLSSVYRYILGHKQLELVSIATELKPVNNLLNLLNEVHGGNINLITESEDILYHQVVPGTLVTIIEQIVRNTITTHRAPLNIYLSSDSDGYIEIKHRLREKLNRSTENEKVIEAIQRSYNFFSDKPIIHIKAYEECFYKIPTLLFEEESLLVS